MFFSSDSSGLLVYFDTSVFDPNHGLPEGQESLVLSAVRSQGFRLIFDLDCFLEPLLAFRGLTGDVIPKAAQQLERMLKWCDLRRIVGPAEWLLAQSVLSYSESCARVEEFLNWENLDDQLERELKNWDSVRSPRNAFWQSLAGDIQRERDRFEDSSENLLQELGPRDGFSPGAAIPTFREFWDEHKNRVAQTFAESIGQDVNQRDPMAAVCRPGNRRAFQGQMCPLGRGCDDRTYVFALLQRRSAAPEGQKERRGRCTARHRGVHGRDFCVERFSTL